MNRKKDGENIHNGETFGVDKMFHTDENIRIGENASVDRIACLLELGYTGYEAEQTASGIGRMSPLFLELVDRWFLTGELPDEEFGGFTVRELVKQRGLTVPAAFLYLDWVMREPEAAMAALADMADELI